MSGRAAFLDSLGGGAGDSSAPSTPPRGVGNPVASSQPQHNWALDVVDSGENTNYVALARARSRAIASRVHDLHHVFTAYRQLLLGEAAVQAAEGGVAAAPFSGDEDDEAQLFSALAQSVMQMSEDVHRTGRGRAGGAGSAAGSRRRAKPVGSSVEARETEEQFESLVDLLAKQATKLTDDLDAIVLLAQARIDRADADAQTLAVQVRDAARAELAALRGEAAHQVRQLLDLNAVRQRSAKTVRRCFSGWRDRALHLTHRQHTLKRAAQRLVGVAIANAWGVWVGVVHETRLEAAHAEHSAVVEAARVQMQAHHERLVEQSFWRSQARSDTRLLQASVGRWCEFTAGSLVRKLAMRRVVQRLSAMQQAQAWKHWTLFVEEAKVEREQVAHSTAIDAAETRLHLQRESGARQVLLKLLRGMVAAAFDAWRWDVQHNSTLELTRLRAVSRLGALYQARAWQQWVAVVEEARVTAMCAAHDQAIGDAEAKLRSQRELIVRQAKHRSDVREVAKRLGTTFSGWFEVAAEQTRRRNLLTRATARMRMGVCYAAVDAWRGYTQEVIDRKLTMQRVVHRIGSLCASRALSQWVAQVDDARAQREQQAHVEAMDLAEAKLHKQRDSAVDHVLLRRWRQDQVLCFTLWAEQVRSKQQLVVVIGKVVVRIKAMMLYAAFDAWNVKVGEGRQLSLTRLRAVSRIAGLYQQRAWLQWIAVVDEAKSDRERTDHVSVVQSVGTALMMQWDTYVRLSQNRAYRRLIRSCFTGWADQMVMSASLIYIKRRIVSRVRGIRVSAVMTAWRDYTDAREMRMLTLLRVVKRLGDLALSRSWQAWLSMVGDQRLAAERDAHRATALTAQEAADVRRERLISQSAMKMGARGARVLLHSAFHCWISWTDLSANRRLITLRVMARTGVIYLRLVLRAWCAVTEESDKNRERLEYNAIIDDAEDILATQWETTVRHYLGRMDRLRRINALKWWVEWATTRAMLKNTLWRVRSRLDAMRAASSFVAWQAVASRLSWRRAVCVRAVKRMSMRELGGAFGAWQWCVVAKRKVKKTLSRVERNCLAETLAAWKAVAQRQRDGTAMMSYRAAVESAENLCLAQFHRSIQLLTERCAKRRALRWLNATWMHWIRFVEVTLREKQFAKAEFDLQEMQRQAEQLVELRVELAESHREQEELCHEAEQSARREKAAAEAHFAVEQERSEQVHAVAAVRDEVLGLRTELSDRERALDEASHREQLLAEHRELAERSKKEAERHAELERSEFVEMQKRSQIEHSMQAQSIEAAQSELLRMQRRETAEIEARQVAERQTAEAERRAEEERRVVNVSKRQAQVALDEISRLRKREAEESVHRQRAEAEIAQERVQQAAVIKTVEAEVSRMQEIFHAAGTPPASPRAPKQPGNAHEAASSIAEALRETAEVTQEELHRRAESVASLQAELAKAQADAILRAEAEAEAVLVAQAHAQAIIAQVHDSVGAQQAAREIVNRVESMALGEQPVAPAAAGGSRARRGSWLLGQSPGGSPGVSPPVEYHSHSPPQHLAPQLHLSPEAAELGRIQIPTSMSHRGGGLQIGFGGQNNHTTPPRGGVQVAVASGRRGVQAVMVPRHGAPPNTVQRGAAGWRAYELEAEELNAQAKADAKARRLAEKQADEMAAKLARMQALLADDDAASNHSSNGLD